MNETLLPADGQGQIDGSALRGEEKLKVTVTGGRGMGKTLLSRWLADFLDEMGHEVRCVRSGDGAEMDFWSPVDAMEPVEVTVVDGDGLTQIRGDAEGGGLKTHSGVGEGDESRATAIYPAYWCAEGYFSLSGRWPAQSCEIALMRSLFGAVKDGSRRFFYVQRNCKEMLPIEVADFVGGRLRFFEVGGKRYRLMKVRERRRLVFEVRECGREGWSDEG